MRYLHAFVLSAALVALPVPALAQGARAGDLPPAGVERPPPAGAESMLAAPSRQGNRVIALVLEGVSPLGGPGCFYRRRHLAGMVVVVGSLLGAGLLLDALHHHEPDGVAIGAVAYGLARAMGLAAAARSGPVFLPSWGEDALAPRMAGRSSVTARTLGFSYRIAF